MSKIIVACLTSFKSVFSSNRRGIGLKKTVYIISFVIRSLLQKEFGQRYGAEQNCPISVGKRNVS